MVPLPRAARLPCGPLLHHDSEIVQLLNGCLDISTDLRSIFRRCSGNLSHRNHTPVSPRPSRQSDHRGIEIAGPDLDLLPSRCLGPQHRTLPKIARVRIRIGDAERDRIRPNRQKRIGPRRRVMYIDVHTLRRQRNAGKLLSLLIACCRAGLCRGLGLVFGIYGTLCNANDRLFLLMTSNQRADQQPGDCRKPARLLGETHT